MQSRDFHLDKRIKLRHLTCFIEVAKQGSTVKAAQALGLSQPAVSKTIQELESSLETKLFESNRRSMILTSMGEIFQRYAASSLTALKQGLRMVAKDAAGAQATFTIGALPTVSANTLPAPLAELTRQFPEILLRIVTGSNDVLMSQLRLGDVDLVVGRMVAPDMMKGFAFEHLYSERIAFAVRPGHPLLSMSKLQPAAIGRYQLLIPPPGSVIHPIVERYFIAHSVNPSAGHIETVSDAFARNYIIRTDAIWIISEGVVAQDVIQGMLAVLAVDTQETMGPVGLTTRTDTEMSYPGQLIMAALRMSG